MITFNIGSAGGRDYATMAAAWAAVPSTLADNYTLLLYNDSVFSEGWNLTSRNTSSGTFTISIKCAAGHSFHDAGNKLTTPLAFNSNGVRFSGSPAGQSPFRIDCPDVSVEGIMFDCGTDPALAGLAFGAMEIANRRNSVTNCVLRCISNVPNFGALLYTQHASTITNCLFYQSVAGGGVFALANTGGFNNDAVYDQVHACTFYTGSDVRGAYLASGTVVVDCAVFAPNATTARGLGASTGSDYNCSDATSGYVGAHSLSGKVASNQFSGLTQGSEDFRVIVGADCIANALRDQTYTADLDILLQGRSTTTPTIGADEFVTSALADYHPGSDISAGNWTPSIGATLWGTIDEASEDDSDFDQSGINPSADIMEVKFVGVTSPGSTASHSVTYAIKASGSLTMTVSLVCATTVIASWVHNPAPAVYTAFTQNLTAAQASNITNYSDLRLRVQAG